MAKVLLSILPFLLPIHLLLNLLDRVGSPLLAQQEPVSAYTNPAVTTVAEETPLEEVIDALLQTPLKRVVVVDSERRVKGIISDVDVLARVQAETRPGLFSLLTAWTRAKTSLAPSGASYGSIAKGSRGQFAADVMNTSVVTIAASVPVREAVEKLLASKRKILPVVDEQGRLLGTVGRSQLLHLLLEEGRVP